MSGLGSHHSVAFRFGALTDGVPSGIATGQGMSLNGSQCLKSLGVHGNREVDLTLVSSEVSWTGEAAGQDNRACHLLVEMEGIYATNSEASGFPGGAMYIHNNPFAPHHAVEENRPLGRVELKANPRFRITAVPLEGLSADGIIDNLIGMTLIFSYV